jgi:hypothetical protein
MHFKKSHFLLFENVKIKTNNFQLHLVPLFCPLDHEMQFGHLHIVNVYFAFFRYHLQALRHLYVLAAEPRLLIPRDVGTGHKVFAHVKLELSDTMWYSGCTMTIKAPCMLPELHLIKRVSIEDERYHRVTFENLTALRNLLIEGMLSK